MTGKAFGEENPTLGETAVSWQTWSDGAAGIPDVDGDADWGKLKLDYSGEEGRSAVYDLGSAKTRTFTLTENRYGIGSGNATLQYRTDTVSFLQDDVLPAWSTYNFPFSVNCQYIQTRETTELLAPAFFVATAAGGGDDLNPGTEAEPWLTIQHAIDEASPGDTIYIRGGTYAEKAQAGYGNGAGTAGNYVTYRNYPGETVIMDGDGIDMEYSNRGLFWVNYSDYINVVGIQVINSNMTGIGVTGGSYVVVRNCKTTETLHPGIYIVFGDNILVDGNEIQYAAWAGDECLKVASSDYVEVKNNIVHEEHAGTTGGEGINICLGCSHVSVHHNEAYNLLKLGFGLEAYDAEQTDCEMHDNISHDNEWGFIEGSEQGGLNNNPRFYNNIAYNNEFAGFYRHSWMLNGATQDAEFINNTSYNNGYGIWINSANITNCIIRNNIFAGNTVQIAIIAGALAECTVDHNLYYVHNDGEPMGTDAVEGDPVFEDVVTYDFHLQATSAAIGMGALTLSPTLDYDNVIRGVAVDIGSYEYVAP